MKRFVLAVSAVFLALPIFASTVPDLSSPYRAGRLGAKRAAVGEERLELDVRAVAALRAAGNAPFTLSDFPVAPGTRARLILRRFEIASPDARIRVTGPRGDTFLPMPEIAHFSGTVAGEPDSTVYLGVQPNFLTASIESSAGSSYVGPDEARSGFIVRDAFSPANTRYAETPWHCDQELLPEVPARGELVEKATEAPDIVGFQKGGLIVETDQELLAKFSGDINAMTAYLLSLFAQFNLIYERDLSFHLTVTEVHAWTTPDPWDGPGTLDQLNQLGDWYHTNRPLASYPRTTVHLTSGLPVAGGVAWRPALCIADIMVSGHWAGAYGISQIFADYPAQKWDLIVTTHEVGHNSGSLHTHCYVPPIDMCYSGEPGCYSGPTSLPPGGGTLMSYCHLLPGGEDNINLLFHQRCITEQLLPYIQSATCTSAVQTFPDVPVTNPFFHYVETIYQLGITGGCQGGNYCPGNPVTRAQMAVFLVKSKYGAAYVPGPCAGLFGDVPCSNQFAVWIEKLYADGISGGCNSSPLLFCPDNTVTRKQMAPFLLKSLYGSGHVPPTCTGVFSDVPCSPGVGFDDFIEELYALKITGGCQASPLLYCPDNANTRAQMAVFLVKTFNLVW
jgi:metallopeptidase family M12-like protein/S-layer family protein